MKNLIVVAAACASMLLMGYDCAFAGQNHKVRPVHKVHQVHRVHPVHRAHRVKVETVSLKAVTRSTGYATPQAAAAVAAAVATPGASVLKANPYADTIAKYANQNGVPVELATAVVQIESNFNPRMRGSAGEIGLMQVKPATARLMGYSGSTKGLYDPDTNIRIGMKYLAMAQQLGGGPTCNTILKYNAGHGATRMNPVSQRYCGKVLALLD
ncbi:lytic transglycosylase domain-containing protein [Rhizobium sp. 2YAF20]|uniref:lytic transglycosylase domain-containing protein n=1 Tax=Rhizobium sp. 2YAF20 TaxID=3233027 RepID=UPI003F9ACECB